MSKRVEFILFIGLIAGITGGLTAYICDSMNKKGLIDFLLVYFPIYITLYLIVGIFRRLVLKRDFFLQP